MYQQNVVYKILAIMVWWLLGFAALADNDATNLPRMALVIGNSAYQGNAYLSNPVNDAVAIAKALRKLNFTVVTLAKNLPLGAMKRKVNEFSLQLRESGGVGLFYFSGHGLQHEGENYLLPVGAEDSLTYAEQLPDSAVTAQWVLSTLMGAHNRMNIVLIDACRNNPLRITIITDRGKGKLAGGLAAPIAPPDNFIIGYAAAAGKEALNGRGNNSPYVIELLANLQKPGLNVEAVLKAVRKGVETSTHGVQQPQSYHALSDEFVFNPQSFEPEMVAIPGGSFMMGSPEGTGYDSERPQHEVTVAGFSMGKYEVTQGEWQAVMGSNPSDFSSCGERCPVENVSWDDVQVYIKKLNAQTGKTYRLPSEAEWEYACRGGAVGDTYCGGNDVDAVAWYNDNSGSKTHPIGQKAANGFGLFDMSGNVWEWCQDYWYDNYQGAPNDEKPRTNKGNSDARAGRGGSWYYLPVWVRAADRSYVAPSHRGGEFGFRLVQD